MSRKLKSMLRWKTRILPIAALGVIGVAGTSHAYNEASIQVNGSVRYACSVNAQSFTTINHTVPDLVASNGSIKSYSVQFDLRSAACNYGSTLTLSSENGRLKRVGDPVVSPDRFADAVAYAASLSWGSGTPVAMVSVGQQYLATVAESAAKDDTIRINFDISQNNTKLIEGYYTDLLKIRLQSVL